jgi:hypothetical protein
LLNNRLQMRPSGATGKVVTLTKRTKIDQDEQVRVAPQLRAPDYTTFNPFEPPEYMHLEPSSHSGRIVGKSEVICPGPGLVIGSRHLVRKSSADEKRVCRY